jgi:hypothetical protein
VEATLRDDYVDASFGRLDGLRDRGDLQHHARADSVGLLHQIAGIAEREGDDPRPRLQRIAKYLRIQGLRDVIYRKGRLVSVFTTSMSRLTVAVGRNRDPMPPNPPSLDTAAASSADVHVPIGARMIGTPRPRSSHSVSSTLFSLHDPRVVLVDGVAADCSER